MLEINSDVVCRLIELAQVLSAREQVVLPEDIDDPAEDWGRQRLADQAGDPAYDEFRSIIENTDPDMQVELVGLLWLGRGDYTLEEWPQVIQQAAEQAGDNTAEYLAGHPLLATYLQDGLALHGYDCEEAATPWK